MRANPIRFTGMASGMDTDSIVRDLMRPQQYKIDQQKKQQALLKLKEDAWKDMNKKLYDFHTKFTDKLRSASAYNQNKTTSSHPDAISIDKDSTAPEGVHVFEVKQLATSASAAGKVTTLSGNSPDTGTKIKDLINFPSAIKADGDGKKEMTLQVILNQNGKEKIIDLKVGAEDTLSSLQKQMNDKGIGAKYDAKNDMFFVNLNTTGSTESITFTAPNVDIDETGLTEGQISQQKSAGRELFRKLGLLETGKTSKTFTGQDAVYTYNNNSFNSASNKIEINGIKATLKAESTGPITISAEANTDGVYTWVKEFITEYNTLIDDINTKMATKPGKDILPLTAEERDAMSDSDIKLWEDKINSSLFYKDPQLTEFVESARRILGEAFEGKTLASIGIVTGSWQEKGKLYILGDEDSGIYSTNSNKLKAKLEENSADVVKLLRGVGEKLYEAHNETLISSSKLKSAMKFYNDKGMIEESKVFDKRIATMEERMYKMEDMQYRKFAAMEKMLSSLNSQGSWLAQQFGGM